MKAIEESQKGITRRNFIKDTAVGGVVVAASDAVIDLARAEGSPVPDSEGISMETCNT